MGEKTETRSKLKEKKKIAERAGESLDHQRCGITCDALRCDSSLRNNHGHQNLSAVPFEGHTAFQCQAVDMFLLQNWKFKSPTAAARDCDSTKHSQEAVLCDYADFLR